MYLYCLRLLLKYYFRFVYNSAEFSDILNHIKLAIPIFHVYGHKAQCQVNVCACFGPIKLFKKPTKRNQLIVLNSSRLCIAPDGFQDLDSLMVK
jgi:hypothetical protein